MRCGFCFATFQDVKQDLPKGHLDREDCILVVDLLARAGFAKINFAGGEPTLCPWLSDLVSRAKEHSLTTSIVTNGTRISPQWLDAMNGNLDWIALSIDTVAPDRLKRIGRTLRGNPVTVEEYLDISSEIKKYGIRLKINSVVTSHTWDEDFTEFIKRARPERWKILQVLPVKGQNDESIEDYLITDGQFQEYIERNRIVESDGVVIVAENNDAMTGSYIMVDPAGRFFDNAKGRHTYSKSIIEVGVEKALKEVFVDAERFLRRDGIYDW